MKVFVNNLIIIGAFAFLDKFGSFIRCEEVYKFPEEFTFGAASASYQIEGAWNEDGKDPSIWDTMTHKFPNLIADKSNADVSADSYHLYRSDVEALKAIGFDQYRFSVSWGRVLTNGSILNPKGIEYYSKLINTLLEEGIEPVVTLYHWDLPQYIQDLGGFTNPLIIDYFRLFADVLFENFGDRVKTWITFNEPYTFCTHGYSTGFHAPRVKASGDGEYLCSHFLLQAHAAAFHLYKSKYFEQQKGRIGISLNTRFFYKKDETVPDSLIEKALEFKLGWYANPIFSKEGGYPQVMMDVIGTKSINEGRRWSRLPTFTEDEKKALIGSADFLALNYYTSRIISPKTTTDSVPSFEDDSGLDYSVNETWTRGASVWLYSVPDGLHDLLLWIKDKYNNPAVLISENGFSDAGGENDDSRISYLRAHLTSVARAIDKGCNVTGFTVWSLIDNFEWTSGYTEKFGIFSVNMSSVEKERTAKKSALFMKQLINDKTLIF